MQSTFAVLRVLLRARLRRERVSYAAVQHRTNMYLGCQGCQHVLMLYTLMRLLPVLSWSCTFGRQSFQGSELKHLYTAITRTKHVPAGRMCSGCADVAVALGVDVFNDWTVVEACADEC